MLVENEAVDRIYFIPAPDAFGAVKDAVQQSRTRP